MTENEASVLTSAPRLRRQIGLPTAAMLVIGEVIGIGIFLTPAGMAKTVGSPLWLLIIWLVMVAMAICGALCFGELGVRCPEAGGFYSYLREAYGPPVAFMYGWMAFLVMDPGLTAALAVGLSGYAAYVLNISGFGIKAVAVGTIVLVAAINILGVKLGGWFIRSLTILKLGLLGVVLLWGVLLQLGDGSNFTPFAAQRPTSDALFPALTGGVVLAFFSFGGWWDLSKLAGEVRDPAKTLPKAYLSGVLFVGLTYVLTSAVFIYLVPVEQAASSEAFAAQVGEVLFGRLGAQVFTLVVIVAILGSMTAVVMSAPRVYLAMSRDGLFLKAAAELHPRFETPAQAIALQAGMASLLVMLGTFNEIVSYFMFVMIVFLGLSVAALFVLRRRDPKGSSYLTPMYPLTPIFFLALVALLLILLGTNNPLQAFMGTLIVTMGLPFYFLLFRQSRLEKLRNEETL